MNKILLALLLTCAICTTTFAQGPAGTITIKGVVLDSLKAAPLGYVTIGVRESGKKEALKSTYTKDNGTF